MVAVLFVDNMGKLKMRTFIPNSSPLTTGLHTTLSLPVCLVLPPFSSLCTEILLLY